jgi:hypothetical protein
VKTVAHADEVIATAARCMFLMGQKPKRRPWSQISASPQEQTSSAMMTAGVDRFAQPLQSELDIVRLQMAPALDLGLASILREALEVFRRELLRGCA